MGLTHMVEYAERVSGHLEQFTFEQRRETVLVLKTHVALYRTDRPTTEGPRVEATITLPLAGTLRLPIDLGGLGALVGSSPSRSSTMRAPA